MTLKRTRTSPTLKTASGKNKTASSQSKAANSKSETTRTSATSAATRSNSATKTQGSSQIGRTTATKHRKKPAGKTSSNQTQYTEEKRTLIRRFISAIKSIPPKFPFWARLKIGKNRTTLVIDEDLVYDKQKKKMVLGFVHREATHSENPKNYEIITPNPDESDPKPMQLKRPRKTPKRFFEPHNKKLNMPEELKNRYKNNNNKGKKGK